ncbi:hypothetical protein FP2506_07916 [Fulvimarina pelagi HTCC2506]|uniref:Uncharacterized protein n=1 Tax=Fulvimarina pelagi HTCC2506 TaxID=314231 RepID=Q0G6G3_9HYPH|nr:hypothetical protein [Fulvimarina pelagi]EAU42751.1 hypothetical protein FP2506_07916 [Fulvimarina pelagi HTCC2506]
MRRISAGLSAAALASLLGTGTALSADADAFAERLKEALTTSGMSMTYSSASSEGDDVVLSGVSIGTGDEKTDVGELTFQNVAGSTEEGWTVERLPIEDIEGTDQNETTGKTATYAVREMSVENIRIVGTSPAEETPAILQASPLFFDRASLGSVNVTVEGDDAFTLDNAIFANAIGDDGGYTGNFEIENFTAFVPEESEDGSAETVRSLGYEQLSGSASGDMSWGLESGRLSLDGLSFDVEDAGQFDLSAGIGGYTQQLVKSIQEMNRQMEQNPQSGEGAGMAMMGILAQLQIQGISIAFEDDSLTKRLIDYYAEQMNRSPQDVIDLAVQIVEANIAQIGDANFQGQVTDAVRTFLENPTSIRVASEPPQPIPVMQLVGAAMGAPQTIPNVLQLRVQSNGDSSSGEGGSDDPSSQSAQ